MARFGINPGNTLGIAMPVLRAIAKVTGKNHSLALELWDSGVHEARILAGLIDVPSQVSTGQMNAWAGDFDSWDVCDQVVMNLFTFTPYAWDMALEWSSAEPEFIKRAGFALMASLALKDKSASREGFVPFLAAIEREARDERNFVKKAVNWALRQIGKRNLELNRQATACALRLTETDSKAARWNGADARRELTSEAVQRKLAAKL